MVYVHAFLPKNETTQTEQMHPYYEHIQQLLNTPIERHYAKVDDDLHEVHVCIRVDAPKQHIMHALRHIPNHIYEAKG